MCIRDSVETEHANFLLIVHFLKCISHPESDDEKMRTASSVGNGFVKWRSASPLNAVVYCVVFAAAVGLITVLDLF